MLAGGELSKAQKFKSYLKLDWNVQRGGGGGGKGCRKNPLHGEGMVNFWNHTFTAKTYIFVDKVI